MSRLPEHSELQLEIAKSLFDEFQKSINSQVPVGGLPYCEKFEFLELRLQIAWLEVAKKLIVGAVALETKSIS